MVTNTRHLDSNATVLVSILEECAKQKGHSPRYLVMGPGAGVEIADLLAHVPAAQIDTVSLTPLNPGAILCFTAKEIEQCLGELRQHREVDMLWRRQPAFPRVPIEHIWNIRRHCDRLFHRAKSALTQFIGRFPQEWPGNDTTMDGTYGCILENRGPFYYQQTNSALRSAYQLLHPGGVLYCGAPNEFIRHADIEDICQPGDVVLSEDHSQSAFLLARHQSRIAQCFLPRDASPSPIHSVSSIAGFLRQITA